MNTNRQLKQTLEYIIPRTENEAKEFIEHHVSRETWLLLECYVQEIIQWQRSINLFGPREKERFWVRHVYDGYQLRQFIHQPSKILDVGSGGGIPGIILAILYPHQKTILVERDQRKCSFLRSVKRKLGLTELEIIQDDIWQISAQKADIVTARAYAQLETLCHCLMKHGSENAVGLFPKGENWVEEWPEGLQQTEELIHTYHSKTHDESVIICISRRGLVAQEYGT